MQITPGNPQESPNPGSSIARHQIKNAIEKIKKFFKLVGENFSQAVGLTICSAHKVMNKEFNVFTSKNRCLNVLLKVLFIIEFTITIPVRLAIFTIAMAAYTIVAIIDAAKNSAKRNLTET